MYGDVPYVEERHRHRFEVNPELVSKFEEKGMMFVGRDDDGKRMEIMELKDHPFFVAVQYHPEFLSRPMRPSPPFYGASSCGCPRRFTVEHSLFVPRRHCSSSLLLTATVLSLCCQPLPPATLAHRTALTPFLPHRQDSSWPPADSFQHTWRSVPTRPPFRSIPLRARPPRSRRPTVCKMSPGPRRNMMHLVCLP